MEDFKIVDLYLKRDENAIEETKNKYGNYCYSIAQRILHDKEDSEECVNDTYLATWNAIPPHRPNVLSAFVGKITRRLSIDKLRNNLALKRGGNVETVSFDELEECLSNYQGIEEKLQEKELTEILNQFLSRLKLEERKVFVCRYWYNESILEISTRFGYSDSKTKMMLKRTRDKLKEELKRKGVLV